MISDLLDRTCSPVKTLRQYRKVICAASIFATTCVLGAPKPGFTDTGSKDVVTIPLVRQIIARTVELVETKALPPRDQAEYVSAKQRLLALQESNVENVDRRELVEAITSLLATLDVDGHSSITSPMLGVGQLYFEKPSMPEYRSSFNVLATPNGAVLHWTPPRIVNTKSEARIEYIERFYNDIVTLKDSGRACALLIDLTEQKGGNAWPPFILMNPLFGPNNSAFMVDRHGTRTAFVDPVRLRKLEAPYISGRANPFVRFAGLPLAVVVSGQTASAGEMLYVALLGEGKRVNTFGHGTRGLSTANVTYSMPDGSLLVLTEKRYALGDQFVLRGSIPVDHRSPDGESLIDTTQRAAEWVSHESPLCRSDSDAMTQRN
jgi:hypothetical protein